jgi:arylformamidase
MSKFIDISWPISTRMTSYKDSKPISVVERKNFERDEVRDTDVTLNTHTGTHVDAPAHFVGAGATIDQLQLERLSGMAQVIDVSHVENAITAADLEFHVVAAGNIILLKTRNSLLPVDAPFNPNFIYLAPDAATLLAQRGAKAVGIDYLGIERNSAKHETHIILLEQRIPIIEGLRLGHVPVGYYTMVCLPLALVGCEAAPARAILIT